MQWNYFTFNLMGFVQLKNIDYFRKENFNIKNSILFT